MPATNDNVTANRPHTSTMTDQMQADATDGLFKAFETCLSTEAVRFIRSLRSNGEQLAQKLAKKEIAYDTNVEALAKMASQLKATQVREKVGESERAALEQTLLSERNEANAKSKQLLAVTQALERAKTELANKNHDLKELENVKKERDDLQRELSENSTKFQVVQQKVDRIQAFLAPMRSIHRQKQSIMDSLEKTFDSAYECMSTFLGADQDVDAVNLATLRSHRCLNRAVPLPASNSPAAKRMRIASGLIILSHYLQQHIFRATYSLNSTGELETVLDMMASQDYQHESFIRAVLLQMLPKVSADNKETCIRKVVEGVCKDVAVIVGSECMNNFRSRLSEVTNQAVDTWERIQCLEEKVHSESTFWYSNEWRPLPDVNEATVVGAAQQSKGQRKQNQGAQKQGAQKQGSQKNEVPHTGPQEELARTCVVWPSFLYIGHHPDEHNTVTITSTLLCRGRVLTPEQIRKAEEELSYFSRGSERC